MLLSIATTRVVMVVLSRPVPLTSSGVCWPMPSKAQWKGPVTALSWRTWVIDHLELNDFSHWLPWADWLESWLPQAEWLESLTALRWLTWVTDHLELYDLSHWPPQAGWLSSLSYSAGVGQTRQSFSYRWSDSSHPAHGGQSLQSFSSRWWLTLQSDTRWWLTLQSLSSWWSVIQLEVVRHTNICMCCYCY